MDKVVEPGIYRHHSGDDYEVLGEAKKSSGKIFIIYKTYNTIKSDENLWIISKVSFVEEFSIISRFKKL